MLIYSAVTVQGDALRFNAESFAFGKTISVVFARYCTSRTDALPARVTIAISLLLTLVNPYTTGVDTTGVRVEGTIVIRVAFVSNGEALRVNALCLRVFRAIRICSALLSWPHAKAVEARSIQIIRAVGVYFTNHSIGLNEDSGKQDIRKMST